MMLKLPVAHIGHYKEFPSTRNMSPNYLTDNGSATLIPLHKHPETPYIPYRQGTDFPLGEMIRCAIKFLEENPE